MINKDFKIMGIMGLVNDDEDHTVNIYLKNGGTHQCKFSEAWDYSEQNPDKVETRKFTPKRKMFEDSANG